MSELDDLLGDGPTVAAPTTAPTAAPATGGDLLDDLLGEALQDAGSNTAAPSLSSGDPFQIDQASTAPTAADAPKATAAASAKGGSSTGGGPSGRQKKLLAEITLPVVTDVSASLASFKTPKTYFVRFVNVYEAESDRKRRVVTIDDQALKVHSKEGELLREIPIGSVTALVRQSVFTSKTFGFGKDYELHVLLQLEDDKDLYMALGADSENGLSSSADVEKVLTAVTNAYGTVLTISDLREQESIAQLVKWVKSEDPIRRQYIDALAFRTEVMSELQQLTKMDNQLSHSIEALKASSAAQASKHIVDEMARLEKALSDMQVKGQSIERSKVETEKILKALQLDIEKEEARRAATVRETMALEAQQALHRQVAEFEIMRAAHKRDMDTIAAVTNIQQSRLESRRSAKYDSTSGLTKRMMDLDDEEGIINEKRFAKAQHRIAINAALVEAKRRLVLAKTFLSTLSDEIEQIGNLPSNAPLPHHISLDPAPVYQAVEVPPYSDVVKQQEPTTSVSSPPPSSAAAQGALATSAKPKPVIDLDDDDDDEDLVVAVKAPLAPPPAAPTATSAPVVLDDDDI